MRPDSLSARPLLASFCLPQERAGLFAPPALINEPQVAVGTAIRRRSTASHCRPEEPAGSEKPSSVTW